MPPTSIPIAERERTLAALTHLSGLAGYLIPLGGVLIPIILWIAKSDSPVISNIAKQALILNVVVFLLIAVTAPLWLTVILIPVIGVFWAALGLVAVVLPIIGAVKASEGVYYRYPFVGITPAAGASGTTTA